MRLQSISVRRRSRGGRSGDPPRKHSSAISTNVCSALSSILVPIGCTSRTTESEVGGSSDCAPDQVTCVVLIASSSIGQRSSAESRVAAVWQNVSIEREIRRWWSFVNLVGREKSTVRTR